MRTFTASIAMDMDLEFQVQEAAAQMGRSVQAFINDALREGIYTAIKQSQREDDEEPHLPVILSDKIDGDIPF